MGADAIVRSITTECPQSRAKKGRRKKLSSIWNQKEHKARVKAFCAGKVCAWCGSSEHLTAHHPYLESYKGCYTDLELSGCIVLCSRCHFALHKGLVLCPVCGKRYYRVGGEMCKSCYLEAHPEVAAARERFMLEQKARRKKSSKVRHPCGNREKYQGCKNGGTCNYSWKRARACGGFAEATA